MTDVIQAPTPVRIPVTDDAGEFPVRNVYCVGRNYADHAVEMGADPDREPPFFFMKPAFSVATGPEVVYPAETADLHHEVELVVAMGDAGRVYGYAVGVDLTRRDLQAEAKAAQRPWEAGKVFRGAAPVGAITPGDQFADGLIELSVNGEARQTGQTSQMIWKIPEIIDRLGLLFDLAPGDLVFTGTPAGVGPMVRGDTVQAKIAGLADLEFRVV